LVREGTPGGKEAAAIALRTLAANNPKNQATIGDSNGILPLLNLLQTGTTDKQKEYAAWALNELSQHPNNRPKIIDSGGIPILESAAQNGAHTVRNHARTTLKHVASAHNSDAIPISSNRTPHCSPPGCIIQ
jgi:hypothetical protein